MKITNFVCQFSIGAIFGVVIACSPTKFNPSAQVDGSCVTTAEQSCVYVDGFNEYNVNYEVGVGKTDILFVVDTSASMSNVHKKLKDAFSGFIQNLDSKKTNYRVAVTTTDLNQVNASKLIQSDSAARAYISNEDTDRVGLFYKSILRQETLDCENYIVAMFNTFGTAFQNQSEYEKNYSVKCPSPDTRGIYSSNIVISENSSSFVRPDATLSVVLISNDDERQARNSLEANDRAESFTAMMQQKYPDKYWDFNSIIVKDQVCKDQQVLKNAQGAVVSNQFGPSVSGGIGNEYAKISFSAAKDIEGNPRPRGKTLDICQFNYAQHLNDMATQITEEARMKVLMCVPNVAPVVKDAGGNIISTNLYTWDGNKIVFKRGNEGHKFTIQYRCFTGPK